MDMTVSFWMDDKDMAELVELTELRNALNAAEGRPHDMDWTVEAVARNLLTCHFYQLVKKSAALYRSLLEGYKKAEDVPTPAPSPDEPEQEPETVSNAEELPHVETLVPFGEPEELETLIPVRDASGVVRMVTLEEAEAMREAAQGIYAGEPPEPKEPETDSNAEELPAVRRGPLADDRTDIYIYYLEHGELPPGYSPDDFSNDRETDSPALLRDVLFADALFEALSA